MRHLVGALLRRLAQLGLNPGREQLQVFHIQPVRTLLGGGEERRAHGPVSVLVIRAATLGLRRLVIFDCTVRLRRLLPVEIRHRNAVT